MCIIGTNDVKENGCDLPAWFRFPAWFYSSPPLHATHLGQGLSGAYQFNTKLVAAFLAYFWCTDVVLFYFPSIFCSRVSCSGSLQRLERIPACIKCKQIFYFVSLLKLLWFVVLHILPPRDDLLLKCYQTKQ